MRLVPLVMLLCGSAAAEEYAWQQGHDPAQGMERRIPPPSGTLRQPSPRGSFAAWLRGLPLKPGAPKVHLYDGRLKANQGAHVAVVDIDVGSRDLQQCADAVMRLRAEYLWATGRAMEVRFRFTSGHLAEFARFARGERPVVRGREVRWVRSARPDASYASFRRYLDIVFRYAGSYSLARELTKVASESLQAGDVFIQGGFPGHAVLVADVVVDPATGAKLFLLLQSYMPAQDVHLLRNPLDPTLSPWYRVDSAATAHRTTLETPEWRFRWGDLRRFP